MIVHMTVFLIGSLPVIGSAGMPISHAFGIDLHADSQADCDSVVNIFIL